MWFDLTREVQLPKKKYRLYEKLQVSLYLSAFLVAIFLVYRIIFPSQFFQFEYKNPNATSNNITKPQDESRQPLKNGLLPADQKTYFDTALVGNFSQAIITVILDKKSLGLESGAEATTRKSYASFLYPTKEITEKSEINPGAFRDGSLVSYGDSIYIVSGNNIFPIDSPITFLSKGYTWQDVVAVSADEMALYEKAKIFTIANPHPNGTIFKTIESGKYYIIKNNSKRLLLPEEINNLDQDLSPIAVSESSLDIINGCQFTKNVWPLRSYSCEIPINNMQQLIGSDYEFTLKSSRDIKIDTLNIEFKKEISLHNVRLTLSEMINRIKNNYVQ